ncbi:MAG: DegT/DnrJ/EryC1/StrS family aminotransferase [Vicinamibacterales bacterium]
MGIPFVDLRAQYLSIKDDIDRAVAGVLDSGQYVLGAEVTSFETEFAHAVGVQHAVGVNSGTSALMLSLWAAGVGPGDEVLTVPFTFVATVAAIHAVGAHARLVDIDPCSFTMDPDALAKGVTDRTKAVLPVHLFGQPVDMDPVRAVARQHGLTVVEDACQAHGASYNGQPVGSLGHVGCFSFYPTKNLAAAGEGGIIVTNDADMARTARTLRDWGQAQPQVYALKGGNYRLDAIQAAILRVKLPHLSAWTEARRAIAARYDARLEGVEVETPAVMPYAGHVFHVYAVRSARRDALAEALQGRGIGAAVYYPHPIHLQPAYADLGYQEGDLPGAEAAARETLALPIYPELPHTAVETVADAVREIAGKRRGDS